MVVESVKDRYNEPVWNLDEFTKPLGFWSQTVIRSLHLTKVGDFLNWNKIYISGLQDYRTLKTTSSFYITSARIKQMGVFV